MDTSEFGSFVDMVCDIVLLLMVVGAILTLLSIFI
nr:MAG TPA: Hypoxia-inducible lipid droplet-associated protein [Caudoviricetes sp.]